MAKNLFIYHVTHVYVEKPNEQSKKNITVSGTWSCHYLIWPPTDHTSFNYLSYIWWSDSHL